MEDKNAREEFTIGLLRRIEALEEHLGLNADAPEEVFEEEE